MIRKIKSYSCKWFEGHISHLEGHFELDYVCVTVTHLMHLGVLHVLRIFGCCQIEYCLLNNISKSMQVVVCLLHFRNRRIIWLCFIPATYHRFNVHLYIKWTWFSKAIFITDIVAVISHKMAPINFCWYEKIDGRVIWETGK